MINKQMIKNGIKTGIVDFIVDPNMDHGTVCKIGEDWFYFGGTTAEEMNPEEYLKAVPEDDIVSDLVETLDEFRDESPDEYEYFESILLETQAPMSVVMTFYPEDLVPLKKRYAINNSEELCQAIRDCIDRALEG